MRDVTIRHISRDAILLRYAKTYDKKLTIIIINYCTLDEYDDLCL